MIGASSIIINPKKKKNAREWDHEFQELRKRKKGRTKNRSKKK